MDHEIREGGRHRQEIQGSIKCGWCGETSESATNYCANCGDPKNGQKMINQQEAVEKIRKMMDYDGFRDGDCLSRRAVIAVIETM